MKNARGLTRISKKNKKVKNGHSTPRARNAEVSAFIGKYPPDVRKILVKIRETIRKAAPQAQETISYMMPAYRLGGNLVYFSGFKDHISFFPPREYRPLKKNSPVIKLQKEPCVLN